jgi:pyrroloquinoline quinone biosynthesis protein D
MIDAATTANSQLAPRRAIVNATSRPHLPPYVRLQFDGLRKKWVVLSPERVFWPDEVTVDILKLCDGGRSIADISDQLSRDYAAPREVIEADVLEFIQSWTDLRLLRL